MSKKVQKYLVWRKDVFGNIQYLVDENNVHTYESATLSSMAKPSYTKYTLKRAQAMAFRLNREAREMGTATRYGYDLAE